MGEKRRKKTYYSASTTSPKWMELVQISRWKGSKKYHFLLKYPKKASIHLSALYFSLSPSHTFHLNNKNKLKKWDKKYMYILYLLIADKSLRTTMKMLAMKEITHKKIYIICMCRKRTVVTASNTRMIFFLGRELR